jgi:hypothetical protein
MPIFMTSNIKQLGYNRDEKKTKATANARKKERKKALTRKRFPEI